MFFRVTTTPGTSSNPGFTSEYCPEVTRGGVYPMVMYGGDGGGLGRHQPLFVTLVPCHPVLILMVLI